MPSRSFRIHRVLSPLVACTIGVAVFTISVASATASKPDFSSMKFMLGTWNCESSGSWSKAKIIENTTTFLDPAGYWMVTKIAQHSPTAGGPVTVTQMVTYDAERHQWVILATTDTGGYDVEVSPGWTNAAMSWTDALHGATPESTMVVTKVSTTRYTTLGSSRDKSGKSFSISTTCNKA